MRPANALRIVSMGIALAISIPAGAVDNVRNEQWSMTRSPGSRDAQISVRFTADLTSTDYGGAVRFSIRTINVHGNSVGLIDFLRAPIAHQVGAASFEVSFSVSLSCDGTEGTIQPSSVTGEMIYESPQGGVVRLPFEAQSVASPPSSGTLSLKVWGESSAGSNLLPLDGLYCPLEDRTIGVYFDAEGTICHGTIAPGTPGTVYVMAKVEQTTDGLAGAEFRFTGVPAGWSVFPVANPEVLTLGDPFGAGVNVAFRCHRAAEGPMLLYTVLVLASQEVSDVRFALEKRQPPSNPFFHCPVIVDCDEPIFTMYCVDTQPCFVNASTTVPCSAPTAVLDRNWGAMKALYRSRH